MPKNSSSSPRVVVPLRRPKTTDLPVYTPGKVIFYKDIVRKKPPTKPNCKLAVLHHQRPFENGGEIGGWWCVRVEGAGVYVDVKGPYRTERKATRIAQEWAECTDCVFVP